MDFKKRRGQSGVFGQLNGLVVGVIVLVAFVGLGLILLSQFQTQSATILSSTFNGTNNETAAQVNATFGAGNALLRSIPGWAGIIFVVVIIVVIIGLLYLLQGGKGKRG